jgi:hypothetical protein
LPSQKTAQHQSPQSRPTPHTFRTTQNHIESSIECCCDHSHTASSQKATTPQQKAQSNTKRTNKLYFYAKHNNTISMNRAHAGSTRFTEETLHTKNP